MPHPKINFYTPQELEAFADVFINKFHKPMDSLPVKIDVIAQADLGIDIMPFSGLESKYGLHGYLALSLKTIYIEQYIIDEDAFEKRYRFTIAEEIAHSLLHKELFLGVETPEDYFDVLEKISEQEHFRMDLDAKRLAEAILMPAELFRKGSLQLATNLDARGNPMLLNHLANKFNVSTEAVGYRLRHLGLDKQIQL